MIILSFIVGITIQYLLNVRRGISRKISSYLIILNPMISISSAVLLTYYSSGKQYFGLSSVGGLFGMYASTVILSLIDNKSGEMEVMIQNCTFILPLMYSISKVGCLLAGCCHGISYKGLFCIEYSGLKTETIYAFPIQLLESIVFLVIFAFGMIMYKKHNKNSTCIIFILSASAKFILDFLRESHQNKILSFNQILCILLLTAGVAIIFFKNRKNM